MEGFLVLLWIAVIVIIVIAWWKIFTKAGQPGWAAIIPIYNVIVLLKIVDKPLWLIILFLIPYVNAVMWILMSVWLAKVFGKGPGFTLGLIFLSPIFLLILGFGDSQYLGASSIAAPQSQTAS